MVDTLLEFEDRPSKSSTAFDIAFRPKEQYDDAAAEGSSSKASVILIGIDIFI